jgi:uncharacterized membrane protein SirB2
MIIYEFLIIAGYIAIAVLEYQTLKKSKDYKTIIYVIILCCLGYIMALAAMHDYQPLNFTRYIYDLFIPLYNLIYK